MDNSAIYRLVFSGYQESMAGNDLSALMVEAGKAARKMAGRLTWSIYHKNGRCVACGTSRNGKNV